MKNFFAIFALIAAVFLSGCGGTDSVGGENFAEVVDFLASENLSADLEAHKSDRLNYLSTILTRRSV